MRAGDGPSSRLKSQDAAAPSRGRSGLPRRHHRRADDPPLVGALAGRRDRHANRTELVRAGRGHEARRSCSSSRSTDRCRPRSRSSRRDPAGTSTCSARSPTETARCPPGFTSVAGRLRPAAAEPARERRLRVAHGARRVADRPRARMAARAARLAGNGAGRGEHEAPAERVPYGERHDYLEGLRGPDAARRITDPARSSAPAVRVRAERANHSRRLGRGVRGLAGWADESGIAARERATSRLARQIRKRERGASEA